MERTGHQYKAGNRGQELTYLAMIGYEGGNFAVKAFIVILH